MEEQRKKNKERQRGPHRNLGQQHMCHGNTRSISQGEMSRKKKKTFEEIVPEKFPNVLRNNNPNIQGA